MTLIAHKKVLWYLIYGYNFRRISLKVFAKVNLFVVETVFFLNR